MIRKLSFWMVIALFLMLGSAGLLHWKALRDTHVQASNIQNLYQRQKIIDSLTLSLERYRRQSASFRKTDPREISEMKSHLKASFVDGINQLERLEVTQGERNMGRKLSEQIDELLNASARIEPMLFSQDAFQKPEVQEINDGILATLSNLETSTQSRMTAQQSSFNRQNNQSTILLASVGGGILLLFVGFIIRNHFLYTRPIRKVHDFAKNIRPGLKIPETSPFLVGPYKDIQTVLYQLAQGIETYMRERHKFILDVVSDLKAPLELLQAGKYLIGVSEEKLDEAQQADAAESVRRGLAIFSGSLDDLNDLVDFNLLESRLEEKTVDLSDLLSDVARTVSGAEYGKKISIDVPPIPLWINLDSHRIQRVMIQIISKVMSTLQKGAGLSITVTSGTQNGNAFRGVEISIQDVDRAKMGRPSMSGPEQDVLKHWISETGLSMALAHKIVRAHGGTLTAAGIAGTSVSMIIRFPQERIMARGLISPPAGEVVGNVSGLVVQKPGNSLHQSLV